MMKEYSLRWHIMALMQKKNHKQNKPIMKSKTLTLWFGDFSFIREMAYVSLFSLLITNIGCSPLILEQSQSEKDVISADSKVIEPEITRSKTINSAVEEYNNDFLTLEPNKQTPNSNIYDVIAAELLLDHHTDEPAVKKQIDWLLKNPAYLTRVIEKSGPYIYYIYTRVKASGLPIEITLLPIIESAYDPLAYSQSHASGLWQFIPSTAAYLGLERNIWFDARRDIVKSTEVAINYLSYLNHKFGNDWSLTLASYNGGEGTVTKSIKKNIERGKHSSFWQLNLPLETENYVPKFFALAHVIKNREALDIEIPEIPNQPVFEIIELENQIEIETIVKVSGIEYKTFTKFNPGYRRSITPPEDTSNILIPIESASQFTQFINNENPENWLPFSEYEIKFGDTLSEIALDHDSSVDLIKTINDLNTDLLRVGQILKVPHNRGTPVIHKRSVTKQIISHEVLSGDTLSQIAKNYKTTVRDIMLQNKLRSSKIFAGQSLEIQIQTNTIAQSHIRKVFYKIREGDSLYLIAKRFSVSINDIRKWNTFTQSKYIHPGETLTLMVDSLRI